MTKSPGRTRTALALAVALSLPIAAIPGIPAHASKTDDAIAAGIVGLAVGAALSHKHKHRKDIYYRGYQPYYPENDYDDYYSRTFSPGGGIICYRAQRICYDPNGTVSYKATARFF
jgi:hypothetical protein